MHLTPKKIKPSTTSTKLMIHIKPPTLIRGNRSASRMDRPEVPPKAKWLGFLKYTMPTAVSTRPRFSRTKKFRSFSRFSRLKASFKPFIGFLHQKIQRFGLNAMQKYTLLIRGSQGITEKL